MKTFREFLIEDHVHLDLYRRYSSGINKDLIAGTHKEGHYSFLKNYDTSGKGEHEYEHHPKAAILKSIDHHTTHKTNSLKKPVTSYSGTSAVLGSKIHDLSKHQPGHTFSTPSYLSSSHDPKIAHKFAERDNAGHQHLMVFHLPKGFHKSKSIPNAREGGKSHTDERLFARNTKFKHIKSEKTDGNATYHHYKPL